MHPAVKQDHPGACPICGMALERAPAAADSAQSAEYIDMRRRFWFALVLALPVLVLAMDGHMVPGRFFAGLDTDWWQAALATPVVLGAGWPFLVRAWRSVRTLHLNMFTLIALGTGVTWSYSVVALVAPGAFPGEFHDPGGKVALYFEPAAIITVLALLGQVLELRAREATSGAIRALLKLAPATARRMSADDRVQNIALDQVRVGDRLQVLPGDSVPVDGVVIDGRSSVDESMVTGEAMPVTRHAGDAVIGGTLNQTGALLVCAEKVGRDTMLAHIVQLVATAQRSRAPIQRLADRVAGWFVPAVLTIAMVTFGAWSLWGPSPRLAHGLVAGVAVLIIACPCALGLATPMSIMVGIGRGANLGVLIRNAETLERLGNIDTLVVDKTGTLTEGHPAVTAIVAAPGQDEATVLRFAAAVEALSEHPLARAIVAAARDRTLTPPAVTGFSSVTGRGVQATVEGKHVALGNAAFVGKAAIDTAMLGPAAERLRVNAATVVFVAVDRAVIGVIAVADPVRTSTPAALAALGALGIRVVMLTGDNRTTAMAVARNLGIAEVDADVLPAGKGRIVEQLQHDGRIVAMAGDGINDSPALAAADVGIAMSSGADVAIESAGVTLLNGDLTGIVRAVRLSRATMGNIRQSLVFAFAYNAIGIPVAAGVLYPVTGLLLSPAFAAGAMALSSCSVVLNALRLRRVAL